MKLIRYTGGLIVLAIAVANGRVCNAQNTVPILWVPAGAGDWSNGSNWEGGFVPEGMFDEEAFSHMRPHAIIVNVTRGAIIDGPALTKALENGVIGGAGLDVTPEEPLPADHPLWTMSNVIVTPHTAGGSSRRIGRAVDLLCENLRRFLDDRPLLGVIDKQLGY